MPCEGKDNDDDDGDNDGDDDGSKRIVYDHAFNTLITNDSPPPLKVVSLKHLKSCSIFVIIPMHDLSMHVLC